MDYIPGIDISHWQGTINWQSVRSSGVRFAFIKATDGSTYVDEKFAANWQNARQAGLLCAPYHYFKPLSDAKNQAELFLDTIQLEKGDLPPALDLEESANLRNNTLIQRVEIWISEVENKLGVKPIIYSSPSFLNSNFTIAAGGPPLWTRNYILWIANYLGPDVPQPYMPSGWSKWTFWQYSKTGSVNGISSDVDLDWFNGTLEELYALAGEEAPGIVTTIQPYTVKTGDSLESIADQYDITLEALVKANPQLIKAGDIVNIPQTSTNGGSSGGGSSGGGSAGGGTTYIVQPGDTLSAIAARFHTTMAALVQANQIANPNIISVGQQLIIP